MLVICPAAPGSRSGNRTTALRWAAKLRALGHRVRIVDEYRGQPCEVMLALHAHKSAPSVERSTAPVVVALTGTDLYRDLPDSAIAQRSLEIAWRIVVLQPLALERLPEAHRAKTRVIYQSAVATLDARARDADQFTIAVPGHLRTEKDPFRAAEASRLLAASSRIRILQIGRALGEEYESRARREQLENRRYRWLGELSRRESRRIVASSDAVAVTSLMEGGANVVSEAVVDGAPVIASEIEGNVGLLGAGYPGVFETGSSEALAALMTRLETDRSFYRELKRHCLGQRALFEPSRELESWRQLLTGL